MTTFRPHAGRNSPGSWHIRHAVAGARVAGGPWFVLPGGAQTVQDYVTNRIVVTNFTGEIRQSNTTASVELNEPRHGGKTGGHSLWLSWQALTNGIVSFKTEA